MKSNKIIILLSIAGIIIILGLTAKFSNLFSEKHKNESEFKPVPFDKIAKIVMIGRSNRTVVLKRGDSNNWFLGDKNLPVRKDNIEYLEKKFKKLPEVDLVSKNRERFKIYQVTGPRMKRLQLFDKDNNLLEYIIVGKEGPDLKSTFIRKPDSDHVYVVKFNLYRDVNTDMFYYIDKQIIKYDPDNVVALKMHIDNKEEFSFVKNNELWEIVSPVQANAKNVEVNKIVRTLCDLRAKEIDTTGITMEQAGINPPKIQWEITLRNKTSYKLMLGNNISDNYYLIHEGNNYLYQVNKFIIDTIKYGNTIDKFTKE